jgi:hypothetical protein
MKTTSYLHNCNSGDLIGALAGIRAACRRYARKAVIYQVLDMPGHYMHGLIHSVKDEKGIQVTMNRNMFDMLRPLLLAQDYIEDFIVYSAQSIDVDLTVIRESADFPDESAPLSGAVITPAKVFVNIPCMALPGWCPTIYHPMGCNLAEPWIHVKEIPTVPGYNPPFPEMILINRTERYLNEKINYGFLKKYENDLVFTGTEKEHRKFAKDSGLDISRLVLDNFLELAQALKACRFFVGNQSLPWNLANAMGIPRLLEMFDQAPNCQPFVGEDNYGFLHQVPLEGYFELLYNEKAAHVERL